jgi:hypothetical protein
MILIAEMQRDGTILCEGDTHKDSTSKAASKNVSTDSRQARQPHSLRHQLLTLQQLTCFVNNLLYYTFCLPRSASLHPAYHDD